jgi:hypothetical protein
LAKLFWVLAKLVRPLRGKDLRRQKGGFGQIARLLAKPPGPKTERPPRPQHRTVRNLERGDKRTAL